MFEVVILTVISELTQCEFDYMLTLVAPEKKERINKFRSFKDMRNCLLGDVLTRTEICRTTGLSNNELKFSTNTYGKPFLTGSHQVHFNISHSDRYVACVIADEPVGIDIESIKNANLHISERFFTSDEKAYIMQDHQKHRFYEVWTKKESRMKWEGKGLYIPLSSFSVFETNVQNLIYYHKVYENDEVISHACSTKQKPPYIKIIDTDSFICSIKDNSILY